MEEDHHLNLEDVKDLSLEEMKVKMIEMEDIIIRVYPESSSTHICAECLKKYSPETK